MSASRRRGIAASLATYVESRVGWTICIAQTVMVWLGMGVLVSDHSFEFFTGRNALKTSHGLNRVIMNSFWAILAPATLHIVLLILSRKHLVWVYRRKDAPKPRRCRRRRRKAGGFLS